MIFPAFSCFHLTHEWVAKPKCQLDRNRVHESVFGREAHKKQSSGLKGISTEAQTSELTLLQLPCPARAGIQADLLRPLCHEGQMPESRAVCHFPPLKSLQAPPASAEAGLTAPTLMLGSRAFWKAASSSGSTRRLLAALALPREQHHCPFPARTCTERGKGASPAAAEAPSSENTPCRSSF